MQFIINWFTLIAFLWLFSTVCFQTCVHILQPIVPKQTTLDNAVYHHKLGPGNFTPIWTWIYPAARSSIVFEWKTSCFQMKVRKSEGSDIARENIGGERFCAYHFASSALCGIYFWHFMHTLDKLKFMERSPLISWMANRKRCWDTMPFWIIKCEIPFFKMVWNNAKCNKHSAWWTVGDLNNLTELLKDNSPFLKRWFFIL